MQEGLSRPRELPGKDVAGGMPTGNSGVICRYREGGDTSTLNSCKKLESGTAIHTTGYLPLVPGPIIDFRVC